ncbi:MAG TPA: hypothetical protein DEB32_11855 [Stenotrophomonas sp.]|nr:hypothetical protein G9274_001825 [Stenotrophomonas rhizophila]HBS63388.1 hypothetical protein [Stenotrophomonas sp.]
MQSILDRLDAQEQMLHALRGHIAGLDHALRLLLAGCPDIHIIRAAWEEIAIEMLARADPAEPALYRHALDQCMARIADQLNVATLQRTTGTDA